MPKQLVRIAGAFRGDPQHVYSQCARDERVMARLRERQCALTRQCRSICGDTIAGYGIRDDAIELRLQRGGRLRIAVCSAAAVATVTPPGAADLTADPPQCETRRADRLDPVCTLLFLPPQRKRPLKKKRKPKPGDEPPRIPNQEDYESVWRRHDLPRRLIGRRLTGLRAEPVSVRLLIEDMPGSVRFSPLREQRGRWLLWWCEDDVRACPGLEPRHPCHRARGVEHVSLCCA